MREDGQDLIVSIFGNKPLIGGLEMGNLIKYNQFTRINSQIEKKNDKVQRLFNAYFLNSIVSLFGSLVFFITLQHSDSDHEISRYFAAVKSV